MSNEANTKLVILDITNKEHAIDKNKYLLELPDICFSDSLVLFYGTNKDKHFFFYNKNSRERVVKKADDGNISFDISTGNVTPSKMGGEKQNDNDNDNDNEIVIDLNNFDENSNITDILYFSKEHEFKSYIYIIKKGNKSNQVEQTQIANATAGVGLEAKAGANASAGVGLEASGANASFGFGAGGARIKSTGKNKAFLNTKIQMRGRQLTGGSKDPSKDLKIAILYVDDVSYSNIHDDNIYDTQFEKIFEILKNKKEVDLLFILQEEKEGGETLMIIYTGTEFKKNITFTDNLNLKFDEKFLTETVDVHETSNPGNKSVKEIIIQLNKDANIQKLNKVEEYIFKFSTDATEIKALPNNSHPFKKPIYILTYTITKDSDDDDDDEEEEDDDDDDDDAEEEEEGVIPIKYKDAASNLLTLSFIKDGSDFDTKVETIKEFYTSNPGNIDREIIFKEFKENTENTENTEITETNLTSLLYKLDRYDNVYFDEEQVRIHLSPPRVSEVFWTLKDLHEKLNN